MEGAGHQWIDSAPTQIPAWIDAHSPTYSNRSGGSAALVRSLALLNETSVAAAQPVQQVEVAVGGTSNALDNVPIQFNLEKSGRCLRAQTVKVGQRLDTVPCSKGEPVKQGTWIRWEHGAIAHSEDTSLCISIQPPQPYSKGPYHSQVRAVFAACS